MITEETLIPKDAHRLLSTFPKRFYHIYKQNPDGTQKTIEMVEVGKRGTTVGQVIPKRWKNDITQEERVAFQPYYDAWKKGEEAPLDGTALEAWVADAELVDVLKQVNVRTVEQFANLEDHLIVKLNIPNGREKQRRAKAFLETRDNSAAVASENVKLKDKLESQGREIAELRALIEKHSVEVEKRKPGRPRKEVVPEGE